MERKVLLVCAGGMSTSLLMKKMKKYAQENGISLMIEAIGMSDYEDVVENYDVILLGPQVSYKLDEMKENSGKPVDVIATYDYAIGNAGNIFKQVERLYQIAGE